MRLRVGRFSASLPLTLVVLVAACLLFALGTWQVKRLAWKTNLIAAIETGFAQPPVAMPNDVAGLAALEWRPVQAEGQLDFDRAVAFGLESSGGNPGGRLLVPLERAGAPPVLVDMGWIPDPVAGFLAPLRGSSREAAVEGYLRLDHLAAKPWLRPDNDGAGRRWYWKDTDALAHAMQEPGLLPATLVRTVDTEAGPPIAAVARIELPNSHLGYAITWYGLCAALIGVYIAYGLTPSRREAP